MRAFVQTQQDALIPTDTVSARRVLDLNMSALRERLSGRVGPVEVVRAYRPYLASISDLIDITAVEISDAQISRMTRAQAGVFRIADAISLVGAVVYHTLSVSEYNAALGRVLVSAQSQETSQLGLLEDLIADAGVSADLRNAYRRADEAGREALILQMGDWIDQQDLSLRFNSETAVTQPDDIHKVPSSQFDGWHQPSIRYVNFHGLDARNRRLLRTPVCRLLG